MKNAKFLFFSFLVAFSVFTSCQNQDDIIDDMANTTQSASLASTLSTLELYINEDGSLNPLKNPTGNIIFDFCFDFVYPIDLEYNTGATVTVISFEALIEVIINTTEDLFIVGIEFPFEVEVYNQDTNEIEIISINNEDEFAALIESCDSNISCEEDCPQDGEVVCVEVTTPNGGMIGITFPNACLAACEGFTDADFIDCGMTSCEEDCPQDGTPVCVEVTSPNGETVIVTFPNACLAACEGYTASDFIDCEIISCEENCPQDGVPVCVQVEIDNEIVIVIFPNACLAECEGYTAADFIDCGTSGCEENCPQDGEPVCVEVISPNGETVIVTFPNACLAACEGYTVADFIDCGTSGCEENCPQDGVPVCVQVEIDNEIVIVTFPNACLAACEGYTAADFIDCETSGCEENCPQDGEPVCVEVTSPNGATVIVTFPNACLAACEGFTEVDFVDCENSGCEENCPQDGEPVCVQAEINNEIVILTFLNACHAECAGYTEADFIDC